MEDLNHFFTIDSLTASINRETPKPSRLHTLNLFKEEGITTTIVRLYERSQRIDLVPAKPRGTPGESLEDSSRKAYLFDVPHLPVVSHISADSLQNVRPFGSDLRESLVEDAVQFELKKMRDSLDATIEWHRMGALKGKILDKNGRVLVDLFDVFGMQRYVKSFDFTDDLITQIQSAQRISASVPGVGKAPRYRCIVGSAFFDELTKNEQFKRAYDRYQESLLLREGASRDGVHFGRCIFEEYNEMVGGQTFLEEEEGLLLPEGISGLYQTSFSPANYLEMVNTKGIPYYASAEVCQHNKGYDLEAQSNPLSLVTSPRAIVGLKIGKKQLCIPKPSQKDGSDGGKGPKKDKNTEGKDSQS